MFQICYGSKAKSNYRVWESTDSEYDAITTAISLGRKNIGSIVYIRDAEEKIIFECKWR